MLLDLYDDESVLYIRIINDTSGESYIATIGTPHKDDKTVVYIPQWILDILSPGNTGDSLIVRIEKVDMYTMPIATKISIRPLDSVAFESDIIQCFEKAFQNLHSIREGITVPVGIPEFGEEFRMYAHIERIEPAEVSRIVHGEVDVEFIREESAEAKIDLPSLPLIPTTTTLMKEPAPEIVLPSPGAGLTLAERQQQIRESWLKRFQNSVGHQ
jgi:hypothetical protein